MEEFEQALIKLFNENSLPLEAKWYIMRHVYILAEAEYRKQKTLQRSKEQNEEVKSDE